MVLINFLWWSLWIRMSFYFRPLRMITDAFILSCVEVKFNFPPTFSGETPVPFYLALSFEIIQGETHNWTHGASRRDNVSMCPCWTYIILTKRFDRKLRKPWTLLRRLNVRIFLMSSSVKIPLFLIQYTDPSYQLRVSNSIHIANESL